MENFILDAGEVKVPEMPVFEENEMTDYMTRLNLRMQQLLDKHKSTLLIVRKQAEHAMKQPVNAIVFRRDYAKELMQTEDIIDVLFSNHSIYGQSVADGAKRLEQNSKFIEKDLHALQLHLDKSLRLHEEMFKVIEEMSACGDNDLYKAKLQPKSGQNQYESEMEAYQMCLLNKGEMDNSYSATFKTYNEEYSALKETVSDYYAFTNPILERIYAPGFDELQNLYHQLFVYTHEKAIVGMGSTLPKQTEKYNELKCVESKPPDP